MADAKPTEPARKAPAPPTGSTLDRFLRGPAVVILSFVLFGMVNYISSRRYRRWDWTSAQLFTLSSRSAAVARNLREPVDMYVLLARDAPLYADAAELAERYAAASPKVRLHYIDPDRKREELLALAQRLNVQLVESRQGERTLNGAVIVVVRGTRFWGVQKEAMVELGQVDPNDDQGVSRVLNAKITVEKAITEALLQVDRERATKLCFSTGHLEMPMTSGDRSGAPLAEDLRRHNFVVQEVEIHGQAGVPSDCDALLIVGSQRAWAEEDAAVIERYLRAGGNVGIFLNLVVLEGRIVPSGLESVARLGGMSLPPALAVEADADHLLPDSPPVRFRADSWNEHDITRDLRGSSMDVAMVRPVVRAEGSDVVPATLVLSSPRAWGETGVRELLRTWTPVKEAADITGPLPIAMAAEVAGVARRTEGNAAGRLVVVGTSQVVEAPYFSLGGRSTFSNAAFTDAVVGWLTSRRELVNIPARPISRAALLVAADDLRYVGIYVIVLIPLAAALVGIAVWRARKAP
jgi:hypothetical protein